MTLAELKDLPDERLNVMLAKCLGWEELRTEDGWREAVTKTHMAKPNEDAIASPPRFCSDLNEVAKVECPLGTDAQLRYLHNLASACQLTGPEWRKQFLRVCATARQRTIALILTLSHA